MSSDDVNSQIVIEEIRHLLRQIERTLQQDVSEKSGDARELLQRCRGVLTALVPPGEDEQVGVSGDYVDIVVEDEDYLPHGRAIEVRLHYHWEDYDPADEPMPVWGAKIRRIELLSVHYYDQHGGVMPWGLHHLEAARELVEGQREEFETLCTEEVVLQGRGRAHPLFRPSKIVKNEVQPHRSVMARSRRQRRDSGEQRRSQGG